MLSWQGCENLNGTQPISGASATFSRTLTAAEASNGFEQVVLPFYPLIALMEDDGSALVQYTLYKTNGTVGRSAKDFVKITRKMPSGQICGPDNDLCVQSQTTEPEEAASETVMDKLLNGLFGRFRK